MIHMASRFAPMRESDLAGWRLHEYREVDSTNLIAAAMPVWEAVRADRQTAGRGRFNRSWISDEGGLWLSAVLPAPAERQAVPLVVGLAVCSMLGSLGVRNLRMRWPNDILVGDRKLAGLLMDQFDPARVVAGIGLNVANHPGRRDPSLVASTVRLADLIAAPPALIELTRRVLAELRGLSLELQTGGFATLLPRINGLWDGVRQVELDLDGTLIRGDFLRVDDRGRLMLDTSGAILAFEPGEVRQLREI